jgi:S-DNA-T family DNA segregation ATPase FtsK/SpoIIIE
VNSENEQMLTKSTLAASQPATQDTAQAATAKLTDDQVVILSKITATCTRLGYTVQPIPTVSVGPIVSVFRLLPTQRTKFAHLEGLSDDLAIALKAEDVLVKRLPGEAAVAIFVPNAVRTHVFWTELITSNWGMLSLICENYGVPLLMGVDHLGTVQIEDLTQLPHLLVAGSTGSGKSTFLSSILASLVYTMAPTELQLVLSDTKGVEFTVFETAPHLAKPVATNIYTNVGVMDWLVEEMSRRYTLIGRAGVKKISEYNALPSANWTLPYIVFVIDELADLLTIREKVDDEKKGPSIGKICEARLQTLVQKGRAAGIHIIAATQRPDVKVVAGGIKANFQARLSFRLPSQVDSITILNTEGAEHLLGKGDMLYISPSQPIRRMHAPLATAADIAGAVEMAKHRFAVDESSVKSIRRIK